MKKFMRNIVMGALVLGIQSNVVAMSGGNETEMSNENTSGGSNMSKSQKAVNKAEGGSGVPTKAQAEKERMASGQTGAPQKQAVPNKK